MENVEPKPAVRVTAPARLHLGFLDLNGGLGRNFGSIGLAVDRPVTEIEVHRATTFAARGADRERALKAAKKYAEQIGLDGAVDITVKTAVPSHAGLGSGTQLALAVGAAIAEFARAAPSATSLASFAERGARSAIGLAAFEAGGFIVDAGKGKSDAPPPVVIRVAFPADWRIVLILDPRSVGVHGDAEANAFSDLSPMPEAEAAQICRLVLMQLVPGVVEGDLASFGAALEEIQTKVGGHFAAAQGGSPWASPAVGAIARKLKDLGAYGIGQSSWGPTGFAFAPTPEAADFLFATLVGEAKGRGVELMIARGRNEGARVDRL